ncbi:MAG: hypothetical protein ABIQ84_07360, partial [Usitatibacter sp.]
MVVSYLHLSVFICGFLGSWPIAILAQDLLEKSPAADWREIDPENTLYVELPGGRVVIELAAHYAPANAAAVKRL